ncbi:MAG: hypothetical protein ABJD07_11410 [Gemmatimonadaceae bacterium]
MSSPLPATSKWEHCWWTVLATLLPPDTVASRFQRAFVAMGQTGATRKHSADTASAHGGPAPLDSLYGGAILESRAVAFRQGDTTRFRYFVAITPPVVAQSAPRTVPAPSHIAVCGAIAKAAAVPTLMYRRSPNADDSLPVWTRIP